MNEAFSTLTLVKRNRYMSGSSNYPGRSYFDFVIDGVSLYDTIGKRGDWVSTLWFEPDVPSEQRMAARRLMALEASDVPDDRVAVYVCPECGDLGCGALTLKVYVGVADVIWSDFGYENTYEDRIPYSSVGPFRFSRPAYDQLFEQFS